VRAQRRWRVITRTEPDGTLVIAVGCPGRGERVVRALPPGLEGYELASELELAHEEAAATAAQLNA
jgi:hypothetical protein